MRHSALFFICVVLALLIVACGPTRTPAPATPASSGSSNIVYVDVRTPAEFAAGHVSGALNIPHDQMEVRWKELAAYQDKPIALYCRSGRRSALALEVLKKQGFTRAENGGGLEQLTARGVPIAR